MKLTLPQLRKLVESTVKDVMKSKRSLRETFGDETDDPNHPMHDYESNLEGQECPDCGGTNTVSNESVPSMMGYGTDDSSHCNDCDSDFSFDSSASFTASLIFDSASLVTVPSSYSTSLIVFNVSEKCIP
jgi:uncharacterized paraquat-inducible protein A